MNARISYFGIDTLMTLFPCFTTKLSKVSTRNGIRSLHETTNKISFAPSHITTTVFVNLVPCYNLPSMIFENFFFKTTAHNHCNTLRTFKRKTKIILITLRLQFLRKCIFVQSNQVAKRLNFTYSCVNPKIFFFPIRKALIVQNYPELFANQTAGV